MLAAQLIPTFNRKLLLSRNKIQLTTLSVFDLLYKSKTDFMRKAAAWHNHELEWGEAMIAGQSEDIKLAGETALLNRHRKEEPIPPMRARWMDTSVNPKRIAFQTLKKLGIDVRRSRKHPTVIDFIENRGVKVVYDVGANVGQFGMGLRQRGYRGKIFSFEPVKSAFDALKSVAATDGSWNVLQCAIGSETGEVWVNVSVNTI
jgi:hypothetical protein